MTSNPNGVAAYTFIMTLVVIIIMYIYIYTCYYRYTKAWLQIQANTRFLDANLQMSVLFKKIAGHGPRSTSSSTAPPKGAVAATAAAVAPVVDFHHLEFGRNPPVWWSSSWRKATQIKLYLFGTFTKDYLHMTYWHMTISLQPNGVLSNW